MPWSALLSTWCDRREHWLFSAPTATMTLFLIAAGSLYAHDLRACSEEVNLVQPRASGAAEATPATMLVLPCAAGLSQHRQLQPAHAVTPQPCLGLAEDSSSACQGTAGPQHARVCASAGDGYPCRRLSAATSRTRRAAQASPPCVWEGPLHPEPTSPSSLNHSASRVTTMPPTASLPCGLALVVMDRNATHCTLRHSPGTPALMAWRCPADAATVVWGRRTHRACVAADTLQPSTSTTRLSNRDSAEGAERSTGKAAAHTGRGEPAGAPYATSFDFKYHLTTEPDPRNAHCRHKPPAAVAVGGNGWVEAGRRQPALAARTRDPAVAGGDAILIHRLPNEPNWAGKSAGCLGATVPLMPSGATTVEALASAEGAFAALAAVAPGAGTPTIVVLPTAATPRRSLCAAHAVTPCSP